MEKAVLASVNGPRRIIFGAMKEKNYFRHPRQQLQQAEESEVESYSLKDWPQVLIVEKSSFRARRAAVIVEQMHSMPPMTLRGFP